jgi:hypothetical protein
VLKIVDEMKPFDIAKKHNLETGDIDRDGGREINKLIKNVGIQFFLLFY